MQNNIVSRTGAECTQDELAAFVTVAAKGEEVERADIERGAQRAAFLLWRAENGEPYAVAALKSPFNSYKERVFRKAGVPEEHEKYVLELGYIYVEKSRRRNGHGPALVQRAMELCKQQGVYATTRADNKRMHEILTEHGFSSLGSAYKSERSESTARLLLFVRPGGAAPLRR
jgi:GNAT superfamily N-acetyltransferase